MVCCQTANVTGSGRCCDHKILMSAFNLNGTGGRRVIPEWIKNIEMALEGKLKETAKEAEVRYCDVLSDTIELLNRRKEKETQKTIVKKKSTKKKAIKKTATKKKTTKKKKR